MFKLGLVEDMPYPHTEILLTLIKPYALSSKLQIAIIQGEFLIPANSVMTELVRLGLSGEPVHLQTQTQALWMFLDDPMMTIVHPSLWGVPKLFRLPAELPSEARLHSPEGESHPSPAANQHAVSTSSFPLTSSRSLCQSA